jgi:hypothetical protein
MKFELFISKLANLYLVIKYVAQEGIYELHCPVKFYTHTLYGVQSLGGVPWGVCLGGVPSAVGGNHSRNTSKKMKCKLSIYICIYIFAQKFISLETSKQPHQLCYPN